MRIMGLDWGTVRIGVAMTDEEGQMAFPLQETIPAAHAVEEIQKLVTEYKIEKIVVGRPLSLDGTESESSKQVQKFAEKIKTQTGAQIEFVDERFSSTASTAALHQQGVKEAQQRQIKDNIAAAMILEQFLNKK